MRDGGGTRTALALHQYAIGANVHAEGFPNEARKEQVMKPNVGTTDRVIRIVAGLVLLSLIFILEGNARWWGLVGLLPLATGLAGRCALYLPFGIDTREAGHDAPGTPHPTT
jgi:Protein of unknown function (DUF2892)